MKGHHEIPTHLNVADRAFGGLTMRQLLSAAIGLTVAYGAASDLPIPFGARLGAAAFVVVAPADDDVVHGAGRGELPRRGREHGHGLQPGARLTVGAVLVGF